MTGELLLASLLLASAPASPTPREPSTAQVVGAFERHYNRIRTFSADFVQRYTQGEWTQVESGRVYFRKPGRMRWDYDSPETKLFLADGEYAYLYLPQERQVRRTPLPQASEWGAVFALLIGRVDLDRFFREIELVRVSGREGPTRWQLRGLARSEGQGFQEVWMDLGEDHRLLRIEIRQQDHSLMEFHFRNWVENPALSDDLFRLAVPPGTAWRDETLP